MIVGRGIDQVAENLLAGPAPWRCGLHNLIPGRLVCSGSGVAVEASPSRDGNATIKTLKS
jgi:hypothetical protein